MPFIINTYSWVVNPSSPSLFNNYALSTLPLRICPKGNLVNCHYWHVGAPCLCEPLMYCKLSKINLRKRNSWCQGPKFLFMLLLLAINLNWKIEYYSNKDPKRTQRVRDGQSNLKWWLRSPSTKKSWTCTLSTQVAPFLRINIWKKVQFDQDFFRAICILLSNFAALHCNFKFQKIIWPWKSLQPWEKRRW